MLLDLPAASACAASHVVAGSLESLQVSCSLWNSLPAERTDGIWRGLYLHDFVACKSCLAKEGPIVSWRRRYTNRLVLTNPSRKRKRIRDDASSKMVL